MESAKKTLITMCGVVLMLFSFGYGFLAYMTRSIDDMYDGLGRRLEDTPTIIKAFYQSSPTWPGWGWSIFDLVVFWGCVAGGIYLFIFASELTDTK